MAEEIIKCRLDSCRKELTDDMNIEHSQNLGEFFCGFDHALEFYFDYMVSTPLDNSIDDRDDVYFKDGKLFGRTDT